MNDHELDDHIHQLARSYHEPPATPRDLMWGRIEQARAGSSPSAIVGSGRSRWLRAVAGMAAVLVVGIGIGRLTSGVGAGDPGQLASTSATTQRDPATESEPGGPQDAAELAASVVPDDQVEASLAAIDPDADRETRGARRDVTNRVRASRAERLAALSAARAAERRGESRGLAAYGVQRGAPGAVGEGSGMSAYQLAVMEHMVRSEVLLTSFLAESRTSSNTPRTAAQFAILSRDLLKTTRLLLATRPADDQALTRLLEDLELVLMQISQYTSEGRRGDLDAINQSLDRRNVLPKLRSTIPAGASASTGI